MKKIILLAAICFMGCARRPVTAYNQGNGRDVQYIYEDGSPCALVQCAGENDLCLVTIHKNYLGTITHILGRTNSMRFVENYCLVSKRISLGGSK